MRAAHISCCGGPPPPPHPGPRPGQPLIPSRSLGPGNQGPPHEHTHTHTHTQPTHVHGHPDTAVQAGRPHGRVSLGSCPLQPVSPILTSVRKDRGLSSAHEPGQSQWGGPVSQETLHLGLVAQSRQPDR